jgi:hypothetical protein
MHSRCLWFSRISLLLVWLTAQSAAQAGAAAVPPADDEAKSGAAARALEGKLKLIARLIDSETSAIEASGNRDAIEQLHAALRLRQAALDARSRNDDVAADGRANEALRALGQALRAVRSGRNDASAWRSRYDEVRTRVAGFREAYARINAEKARSRGGVLDEPALDGLLARAEKLLHEGNYKESLASLTRAAVMVESALMQIRNQETLVHELKFNSPEEEYAYERRRNQSYEMLVEMAMTEGKLASVSQEVGTAAMRENRAARERAEAALKAGQAKAGSRGLETATGRLMQVLRAGGLPLP